MARRSDARCRTRAAASSSCGSSRSSHNASRSAARAASWAVRNCAKAAAVDAAPSSQYNPVSPRRTGMRAPQRRSSSPKKSSARADTSRGNA